MLDVLYTTNSISDKDEYILLYQRQAAKPLPITSYTTLTLSGGRENDYSVNTNPRRDESNGYVVSD